MPNPFAADIELVQRIPDIEALLERVCALTGMGFAAAARVTEERWVCCHVLDKIEFGMNAGDELEIKTTICDEIRASGRGVFIDHVGSDPAWRVHPVPALYGFESYVSIPIMLKDRFFGTLCALDPAPRATPLSTVVPEIEAIAREIGAHIDRQARDS